jgi:carbamoyltransferase
MKGAYVLTLGVAGGFGHDGAACLFDDGRLVSYAEEERLTRSKLAYGVPPVNAVLACAARAGVDLDQIDALAFSWDPSLDTDLLIMRQIHEELVNAPSLRRLRPRIIQRHPHHESHAAMALLGSDYSADTVLGMAQI